MLNLTQSKQFSQNAGTIMGFYGAQHEDHPGVLTPEHVRQNILCGEEDAATQANAKKTLAKPGAGAVKRNPLAHAQLDNNLMLKPSGF